MFQKNIITAYRHSIKDLIMLSNVSTNNPQDFRGHLWKIKDEQGHKTYLLGSIHFTLEPLIKESSKVWKYFQNTAVLAVEINFLRDDYDQAESKLREELRQKKIDAILPQDHERIGHNARVWLLTLGNESNVNDLSDLQAIALACDLMAKSLNPFSKNMCYMDQEFLEQAQNRKMLIWDLEGMERWDGQGEDILIQLTDAALNVLHLDPSCEDTDYLKTLWDTIRKQAHEIFNDRINAMAEDWMAGKHECSTEDEEQKNWMIKRNVTMANKIADVIKSHPYSFSCVGTSHLVGDMNVLNCLKNLGLSVSRKSV